LNAMFRLRFGETKSQAFVRALTGTDVQSVRFLKAANPRLRWLHATS